MTDADQTKVDVPQQRSPPYPYIALDLALERAKKLYDQVRDHPQPREVLAKAYGKPATSSATIQTFGALLQYGLLQNVMTANGRRMRVSSLAQSILHPHAPAEKVAEWLKTAALKPAIFRELWDRFGNAEINDSVPLYYLTSERPHEHGSAFSDKGAREVLRVYRATLRFAGLPTADTNQAPASPDGADLPDRQIVEVGDLVHVELNGSLQFKDAKRVEEVREYEGKMWVFLEGEKAGVDMDYVTVQERPAQTASKHQGSSPPTRELPKAETDADLLEGWSEERLIDDGGDEIKIRYRGKASASRYEFIRDYLDFKIKRLAPKE